VHGFPTFKWFEGDVGIKYAGKRSVDDLVTFATNKAEELGGDSKVTVLTDASFNKTLKAHPTALIEFYAPWCGHCKALAPHFEEAVGLIGSKALVAKVNCDLNSETCSRYEVNGYPTIIFFRNGKTTPFEGERTASSITEWVDEQLGTPTDSAVETLTQKTFDNVVAENENTLVEFYAPWCGHCKALAPEYEKAAKTLKGKATLAKVDCTAEADLCQKFEVTGYPTLKFFRKGVPAEYGGGRTAADIASWVNRKLSGVVTFLSTKDEVEKWTTEHDGTAVLGVFDGKDKNYEAFAGVADAREDLLFGAVTDKALAATLGLKTPTVKFFREASVGEDLEFDSADYSDLTGWLTRRSMAPVGEIGPESFRKYTTLGYPLVIAFIDPKDKDTTVEILKPVAAENDGKVSFGWADGVRWKEVATRWYGQFETLPVVVHLNFKDDVQLPHKGALSTEAVRQFLADVAAGNVKWTPRSAAVPEKQEGPVFVAVGSTIEEVITQPKDVLVEFYAPWCGHCQHLAPIYDELATELKSVESLVIAKLDHTENDVKHTVVGNSVSGYPTILFFPANQKTSPVAYDGERTLVGFTLWLKEKASVPFEVPASLKAKIDAAAKPTSDPNSDAEDEHDHSGHDHDGHDHHDHDGHDHGHEHDEL